MVVVSHLIIVIKMERTTDSFTEVTLLFREAQIQRSAGLPPEL